MARINYAKEWQRIVATLELTEARFIQELSLSGTDKERREAETKLIQIRSQLDHARNELSRMTLVKPKTIQRPG